MEGFKEDIDIIKSLIAICREGYLPLDKVNGEYREMTGSYLNFKKYGFPSLVAMLESSPNITLRQRPEGIVCHVNDSKMSHVTSLIQRTKVPRKRNKVRYRGKSSYQSSSFRSPLQRQDSSRRHLQPMNRNSSVSLNRIQSSSSQRRADYHQQSWSGNNSSSISQKKFQSPISQRRFQSSTSRLECKEQSRFGVSSTSVSQNRVQSEGTQRRYDCGQSRPQYGDPLRCEYSNGPFRYGQGREKSNDERSRESKTTNFAQNTGSRSKTMECNRSAFSSVSSSSRAPNKSSGFVQQNNSKIRERQNVQNSTKSKISQKKESSGSGWSDDSNTNKLQSRTKLRKSASSNTSSSDLSEYEVCAENPAKSSKTSISSQIKSSGLNTVKLSDGAGSSSDWTSDSDDAVCQKDTFPVCPPKKFISIPTLSVTASKQTGKRQVQTLRSDGEWSSRSEESPSTEQGEDPPSLLPSRFANYSPPLQNTSVSSTRKSNQEPRQSETMVNKVAPLKSSINRISCSFGARDIRYASKEIENSENEHSGSQSVTNAKENWDYDCSPLMVGGVGRGKLRSAMQNRKPGVICSDQTKSTSSKTDGIVVTASPSKREASVITCDGMQSIAVTVQNRHKVSLEDSPSFKGYVLVGDLFLLEVAKVALGCTITRAGPVAYCGLCRDKLTITQCEREIMKNRATGQIVLMIGMTDILNGASFQQLRDDTTSLIQRLVANNNHDIILITVPVPPSLLKPENEQKLSVLLAYNKWLLSLKSYTLSAVIDADKHLYCDRQYFRRIPGQNVETLSEGGCSNVMHEIVSVIC